MAIGDDDKLRGRLDNAKGRVKRAAGEIADDPEMKREGAKDKDEGEDRGRHRAREERAR